MANRVQSLAILSLLMILGVGIRAQSPQPTPQDANTKAVTRTKTVEGKVIPPQPVTNLQGFGTKGQIANFGGGDFLINSLIFESFGGKIGVANNPPGVVKSLNGKTGDLTLQAGSNITITPSGNTLIVSAPTALSGVAHDATLTGEGTVASPLRVVSTESQRQPYAAEASAVFPISSVLFFQLTTVPSGKLLVIEQVTARCIIASGHRLYSLSIRTKHDALDDATDHDLIISFMGPSGGALGPGGDSFSSSQNVRLYAAPATQVHVFAATGLVQNAGVCKASLSGYFIDQP